MYKFCKEDGGRHILRECIAVEYISVEKTSQEA
jgi:hypothetical protein